MEKQYTGFRPSDLTILLRELRRPADRGAILDLLPGLQWVPRGCDLLQVVDAIKRGTPVDEAISHATVEDSSREDKLDRTIRLVNLVVSLSNSTFEGWEYLREAIDRAEKGEKVLVVSQHCSHLDPPVTGCMLISHERRMVERIAFMPRFTLYGMPLFRFILRGMNCIPVLSVRERHNPAFAGVARRMVVSSARGYAAALARGQVPWLYPEGMRSKIGCMLPIGTGVTGFLEQADWVYPVGLIGTDDFLPYNRSFPDLGRILTRKGVIMRVGTPWSPRETSLPAGNPLPSGFADLLRGSLSYDLYQALAEYGRGPRKLPKERRAICQAFYDGIERVILGGFSTLEGLMTLDEIPTFLDALTFTATPGGSAAADPWCVELSRYVVSAVADNRKRLELLEDPSRSASQLAKHWLAYSCGMSIAELLPDDRRGLYKGKSGK